MVVSERGMQASGAIFHVQATSAKAKAGAVRVSAQAACLLLSAAALSGCSDTSSLNPVNWWHRAQGGKIAEERFFY